MESSSRRRQATVLLSGGIDSATVLALLSSRGYKLAALFVDYGQLAADQERTASQRVADFYSTTWAEVRVSGLSTLHFQEVPGRNDFLISVASTYTTDPFVAIGVHAGTPYADCSPQHQDAWQTLFDVQYEGRRRLVAPLRDLSKWDVISLALNLGVPVAQTYSCEDASGPCDKCVSCKDRSDYDARPQP